jgi:hypothetical protein
MPVVDTTQSFASGDTVTSTTLNNIMDQSIFVAGAVVSGSGLAITTGGQMTTSNIPGANITNLSIGGGKIINNTLSVGKLENPSFNWSSASNSGSIELGTNITTNGSSFIDFHSVFPLTDREARVVRNSGANGTFSISNNGTGAIELSASSGVTFGTANMPTPSGTAPIFGCRAWVNFNGQANSDLSGTYSRSGTTSVTVTATGHGLIAGNIVFLDFTVGTGTAPFDGIYEVATIVDVNSFTVVSSTTTTSTGTVFLKRKTIRGSGNVSCVSAASQSPTIPPTSNETVANGYYIANFLTAMSNSNFAILGTCSESGNLSAGSGNDILAGSPYNEKSALITTISGGGNAVDALQNSVSIIG